MTAGQRGWTPGGGDYDIAVGGDSVNITIDRNQYNNFDYNYDIDARTEIIADRPNVRLKDTLQQSQESRFDTTLKEDLRGF